MYRLLAVGLSILILIQKFISNLWLLLFQVVHNLTDLTATTAITATSSSSSYFYYVIKLINKLKPER